jgi:hypothetical protein
MAGRGEERRGEEGRGGEGRRGEERRMNELTHEQPTKPKGPLYSLKPISKVTLHH